MNKPDRPFDTPKDRILEAAKEIFIEQGYSRFTLRKVAAATGISLGNLNYHFPRKDDLLSALLESIIDGYIEEFERRRDAAGDAPEKQLEAVLDFWIDDLLNPQTTVLFPELWALSNHDERVATMTDTLYQRARQPIIALLPVINPRLETNDVGQIALLMCAAMEGLTVFAGFDKPWSTQHGALKQRLVKSFMRMIFEH